MNEKEFLKVKNELENASEDTKPIAMVTDEAVAVKGDVNDIEVKPHDYSLNFVVPKSMGKDIEGAKKLETGFYLITIEYKDVLPTVKDNVKLTSAGMQLMPFYNKLEENGNIEKMSDEEALRTIFVNLEDEIVDALYRLVKVFLGVDEELVPWITPGSVLKTGADLIHDFPHVFNQADLF